MRKFTLLLAFGLSFLWNSTALADPDTTYLWWLKENGDKVSDWIAVDVDGGAWVNINPRVRTIKKYALQEQHRIILKQIIVMYISIN